MEIGRLPLYMYMHNAPKELIFIVSTDGEILVDFNIGPLLRTVFNVNPSMDK